MSPKIYRTVRQQLIDIWLYTEKTWGEEQANAYIYGVESHIRLLATTKQLWRLVKHPHFQNLFCSRYKKHLIFFKQLPDKNQIGIISVLHERMNLPRRLLKDFPEDLEP